MMPTFNMRMQHITAKYEKIFLIAWGTESRKIFKVLKNDIFLPFQSPDHPPIATEG